MKLGKRRAAERGGILLNLIIFVSFVVFCAFLYLVRRPILRFVAESWIVEDADSKADALIVLSDDNFYADRATRAAELFREGKAPATRRRDRRIDGTRFGGARRT